MFYCLFPFLMTVHLIMFEHSFFCGIEEVLKCALINGKQNYIDIIFLYQLEHIQMSLLNNFLWIVQ